MRLAGARRLLRRTAPLKEVSWRPTQSLRPQGAGRPGSRSGSSPARISRSRFARASTAPRSVPQFLAMVFTTPRGWALIGVGAVVGTIFGWVVLALGVVSLPMLVDCDVSAADAVSASWRAAHANKNEMIRWGLTVTAFLVLGSIPPFVGLAFVLPWLGYSTWHLYTR